MGCAGCILRPTASHPSADEHLRSRRLGRRQWPCNAWQRSCVHASSLVSARNSTSSFCYHIWCQERHQSQFIPTTISLPQLLQQHPKHLSWSILSCTVLHSTEKKRIFCNYQIQLHQQLSFFHSVLHWSVAVSTIRGLSPGSHKAKVQRAKVCLNCTEPSVARSSYWSLPVGQYWSYSHCDCRVKYCVSVFTKTNSAIKFNITTAPIRYIHRLEMPLGLPRWTAAVPERLSPNLKFKKFTENFKIKI